MGNNVSEIDQNRGLCQARPVKFAVTSLLACLCAASPSYGNIIQWGTTDGSWGVTNNWIGGVLPLSTDDAYIGSSGTAENASVNLHADTTIKILNVSDGMYVRTNGNQLTLTGDALISGYNLVDNIGYHSSLWVEDNGGGTNTPAFIGTNAQLTNGGWLRIQDNAGAQISGVLSTDADSSINNDGIIYLTGGGTVLRNDGVISSNDVGVINATNGGLLDLDGTIGNGIISLTTYPQDPQAPDRGLAIYADGLADNFDGEINIAGSNFLNMSIDGGWTLGIGGEINLSSNSSRVVGTEITVRGDINSSASVGRIEADATIMSSSHVSVNAGGTLQFWGHTIVEDGLFTVADNQWLSFGGGNGVQLRGGTFNAGTNAHVSLSTDTTLAGGADFTGEVRFRRDVDVVLDSVINAEQLTASFITPRLWTLTRDLTINANTLGDLSNVFSNNITIDNQNILNPAILEVNLPGSDQWTLDGVLDISSFGGGAMATSLRGSDLALTGNVLVDGNTRFEARVDIVDNAIQLNADSILRLAGGTLNDANTIDNANFVGDGVLEAQSGAALEGSGFVLTGVNFEAGSHLTAVATANNNTLYLFDPITSMGTLGTRGQAATLNLSADYDTATGEHFIMDEGTVTGSGIITNSNATGIRGHGMLVNRIDNRTVIAAENGRLTLNNSFDQVSSATTDFDGSTENGALHAVDGSMTIVGTNEVSPFMFNGTVLVAGSNEFHLDDMYFSFEQGSEVYMAGGTIRSNRNQDFSGILATDVASATLDTDAVFMAGSSTTLHERLTTKKFMQVHAGADFTGAGILTNAGTGDLLLFDGAEMELNVTSAGLMRIGDPTQDNKIGDAWIVGDLYLTGTLEIDLAGDTPALYDLLSIDETLTVRGAVFDVALHNGFDPMAGDEFNILDFSAFVDMGYDLLLPDLSPGLTWDSSDFETMGVIRIAAVPEPTSLALLSLGGLLLTRRRRRD